MFALLAAAEYPNAPLDLQLQVGWLALFTLTLIFFWVWTRAESFRRSILSREDPRLFAFWRIGLGVATIQNFWNLLIHWRMLWTDEGMFTGEETRSRLGRAELAGWTEVDGFLDGWAIVKFYWGKYSLLYFDSSPDFVKGYLILLFVVLGLFTIGFRTRLTGVVAFILINSIYNRNAVYLEGHDTVYRCLWLYTIVARTDAAWSVDNWLRRIREGRLAKALAAGGTPGYDWLHFADRAGHWVYGGAFALWFCAYVKYQSTTVWAVMLIGIVTSLLIGMVEQRTRMSAAKAGKLEVREPRRFELIPAWPRYVIIAQLLCIYCATGLYKTGDVWLKGDALYYSLNMDHFYRFEGFTQWVSVYFATNMFRLMTHVTLWWEKLFPLVAVGLVLEWGLRHKNEPWYQAQEKARWRKWLGRAALVAAHLCLWRLAVIALPWCLALQPDKSPTPAGKGLMIVHIVFAGVIPALVTLWFVLGRWPLKIKKPLVLTRLLPAREGEPSSEHVEIGQQFMRNWLFGRRIFLTLGVIFHGILFVFMNIGMFPLIMMWIYVCYFEAATWLKMLRWCTELLRRWKLTRWMAPKLCDDAFAENDEVLESPARAVARDGAGLWWLDPYRLLAGPFLLLTRKASLADIDRQANERGGRIPDGLVLALGALLFGLAAMRGLQAKTEADAGQTVTAEMSAEEASSVREEMRAEADARRETIERINKAGWWWVYGVLGFAAVAHFRRRRAFDRLIVADEKEAKKESKKTSETSEKDGQESAVEIASPPLLSGTLTRTAVLGLMIYHCGAVAALFTPTYSVTQAWRGEVSHVFGSWTRGLNVSQSWKMFSPNPPRGNTFMRTIVIDENDEPYMVGNDQYTNRPYVFWFNDRMRKMHRRMVGKSKWYLKYWGQYHCRDWAFNHDGQLPKEVQVMRLNTGIPAPDKLKEPSDPRKRTLKRNVVETYKCKDSDISPEMKLRRGWPLTDADKARMEAEARRIERAAEGTRNSWAAREDFGGKPKAKEPTQRQREEQATAKPKFEPQK